MSDGTNGLWAKAFDPEILGEKRRREEPPDLTPVDTVAEIDRLQAAAIRRIADSIEDGTLSGREALQAAQRLDMLRGRMLGDAKAQEEREGRLSQALAFAKTLRALRENDPKVWDDLETEYEAALDT